MEGEVLSGRIARVVHQDAARAFAVFELAPPEGPAVTVVGPATDLAPGLDVRVTGAFHVHPRYGRRFKATTVIALPPQGVDGILAYLASGQVKGIGKGLAARLVAHFGADTRKALDGGPRRLREVPGIGRGRAEAIHEAWSRSAARRETFILLSDMGLTPSQAQRVMRALGDEAPARVRENPYGLIRVVPGVGFKVADAIAARVGMAPDAPARLEAATTHVLGEAAEQGHVFLPADRLVEAVSAATAQPAELARTALASLTISGAVATETGPGGREIAFEATLRQAEVTVASRVAILAAQDVRRVAIPEARSGDVALADSQRRALVTVASSPVAVLTGGPGTGKTTIVGSLLAAADRAGLKVALAAPTGRAAMRMREATGRDARTLHRLLEFNPRTGAFARNEAWPLDADWVVVDEASMLDVVLFDRLVRAVPPGTRLTLVGDADQLPPVGPGDPFRDVIASGAVPVARINEVFRQGAGSEIVRNAHRVLHGQDPRSSPRGEAEPGDFHVVFRESPSDVAAAVEQLVCERIPARFGLDPLRDVQTIAPMHRGEAGTDALNAALRRRLVPRPEGARFAPGDRVIQNRNDYDLDVYNGDIGTVEEAGPDGGVRVRFDERVVSFPPDSTDDLGPAHAITVHKAQGSEFPALVVALHTQHYVMLRRNLLYTAITRGRRLVVVVASRRALRLAVDDARREARNTRLAERLGGKGSRLTVDG
jgi:exodeoxyribonuclease V alpha subunit